MDVKKIRKSLGMNQFEFAKKIDYSHSAVTKWETGRRQPSKRAIQAIKKLEREANNE